MTDPARDAPDPDAVYGAFLFPAGTPDMDTTAVHESEALRRVMETAPSGALALCALTVGLLLLGWLAGILLFLGRGTVS